MLLNELSFIYCEVSAQNGLLKDCINEENDREIF